MFQNNINIFYLPQQKPVEDHRRKWDREEYERIARERIDQELKKLDDDKKKEPPVKRELLKPRDYKVGIKTMHYSY